MTGKYFKERTHQKQWLKTGWISLMKYLPPKVPQMCSFLLSCPQERPQDRPQDSASYCVALNCFWTNPAHSHIWICLKYPELVSGPLNSLGKLKQKLLNYELQKGQPENTFICTNTHINTKTHSTLW